MKEKQITVLKVEPHKHPEVCILENDLDSLQKAVSIGADYQGLIEIFAIDDDVAILCNEEAKLIGLEPNRHFYDDVLCGVFYVVGEDDEGNLTSLSDAMLDRYLRLFGKPEEIHKSEGEHAIFMRLFNM